MTRRSASAGSRPSVGIFRVPMVEAPVGGGLRLVIDASDVALATEEPSGLSIRNRFAARIERIEAIDRSQMLVGLTAEGGSVSAVLTRDAVAELASGRGREGLVPRQIGRGRSRAALMAGAGRRKPRVLCRGRDPPT